MAASGDFPSLALGGEGEIDHHDGVLLHDADEQDDADQCDDAEVRVGKEQREQGADAGGRQRGEDRDGVHEALVEDAEHDVDGRAVPARMSIGSVASEDWKACAVPWKVACTMRRHSHLALGLLIAVTASTEGDAGREVEGQRDGRELALVVHRERCRRGSKCEMRRERHHSCRSRSGRRCCSARRGLR